MYRCLFIDLDDTLWDTFANNRESLEEVYAERPQWQQHFASFEAFFDIYYGVNNRLWGEYRDALIDRHQLSQARFREPLAAGGYHISDQEVAEANADFLSRAKFKTRTCPAAVEVLAYLHQSYQICIVSNGFREMQYTKLECSGLAPHVDHVLLSEDVGCNKPHPLIFERALADCGVGADEVMMIGDSWDADIVGAYNAGLDAVWYNSYGMDIPADARHRPRYIISHLNELRDLL